MQKRKKKLNCCARFYIYLQKYSIEQIFFIQKEKKLNKVYEDLKRGKVSILTKVEEMMLKDIKDLKEQRKKEEDEEPVEYDLAGMKRTKANTTCGVLSYNYFNMLGQLMVTYS